MVGGSFQSIDRICFCINREEVDLELLFEVPLSWDRENTGICFLMEHILGPLGSVTTFEECEGPKDFLLFVVELLRGQADVERAGVQKCTAFMTFSAEVQKAEELGMCSFRHWGM